MRLENIIDRNLIALEHVLLAKTSDLITRESLCSENHIYLANKTYAGNLYRLITDAILNFAGVNHRLTLS